MAQKARTRGAEGSDPGRATSGGGGGGGAPGPDVNTGRPRPAPAPTPAPLGSGAWRPEDRPGPRAAPAPHRGARTSRAGERAGPGGVSGRV